MDGGTLGKTEDPQSVFNQDRPQNYLGTQVSNDFLSFPRNREEGTPMVTLSNRIMVQTSWLPSLSSSHSTLSSRKERRPWRVLRVGGAERRTSPWRLAGWWINVHTQANMEKLKGELFRESSQHKKQSGSFSSQKRGDFGIQGSLLRLRGTGRWDPKILPPPPSPHSYPTVLCPLQNANCLVGTQS